jgi:hypothetical protein
MTFDKMIFSSGQNDSSCGQNDSQLKTLMRTSFATKFDLFQRSVFKTNSFRPSLGENVYTAVIKLKCHQSSAKHLNNLIANTSVQFAHKMQIKLDTSKNEIVKKLVSKFFLSVLASSLRLQIWANLKSYQISFDEKQSNQFPWTSKNKRTSFHGNKKNERTSFRGNLKTNEQVSMEI